MTLHPITTEHDEQCLVIDWAYLYTAQWPELDLLHAIPNGVMLGGGKIGAIRMNVLKGEGLRPGTPDLFLPSAHDGYFGLYIEMKIPGGKLSENQEQFIAAVEKQGYLAVVCWGADEAIEILTNYLKAPRTRVKAGMAVTTRDIGQSELAGDL